MADGIPDGITRNDVATAIADFDAGALHEFAPSTGYDLIFNGKRYPPKAIIGLAARRIAGRTLTPYDFKGGEGSRCFRVLRELGFEVAAKVGTSAGAAVRSYILCWNPKRWEWTNYGKEVNRSTKGRMIHGRWSTGNTKTISEGQRVYLYRQALDRGIIGSGWTASDSYMDDHWDGSDKKVPYVDVVFDRIAALKDVLPVEGLIRRVPNVEWNRIQASGVSLHSDDASKVEALWQEHLKGLGILIEPDELATPALYVEGATRIVAVNAYERNPRARRACLAHYGLDCSVCGFNFAAFYGEIGVRFIHVHHLKDLATVGGAYEVDPIKDLRPVCPNCHAMLHVETPAMSIGSLKTLVNAQRVKPKSSCW